MAVEHSQLRGQRHTLTLPHTAKPSRTQHNKEQTCQYIKPQVHVVVKVGNTVVAERYIQPEHRLFDKHRQLKQAKLEQRKLKRSNKAQGPGSESD